MRIGYLGQLALTAIVLVVVLVYALGSGRYDVSFVHVIEILTSYVLEVEMTWGVTEQKIIEYVRLPRILVAGVCGAALSLSGAVLQGIFRNPLVGPEVIGVSSGAAFGGVLAILLMLHDVFVPILAFGFGVASLFSTMFIAKQAGKNVLALILAGIVTSAFFGALVSLMKYVADPDDTLPAIVYWLLGSFNASSYADLAYVGVPMAAIGFLLYKMRFIVNLLSLGDEEARSLGINVPLHRWLVLMACTLITASSVSVSGIVGWVGLVIPHFVRMITGANHARILPLSMLCGAVYMIVVDTIARTATYGEIPIGVLTSLVGAPVFGWLLYRTKMRGWGNA